MLILPSLNGYLELLGVGSSWLGVCIGSLNFAALITNIPCGLLVDHTGNVRLVATALALCCALGNILYVCIRSIEAVVASSQVPKFIDLLIHSFNDSLTNQCEEFFLESAHLWNPYYMVF